MGDGEEGWVCTGDGRWSEEGGKVRRAQIKAMGEIANMMRNMMPLTNSALMAPAVSGGAFFSAPKSPTACDADPTWNTHVKLASHILAQGPATTKTPMSFGLPSIEEVMNARGKATASQASTRSPSAPMGRNNQKNKNKRASKAQKRHANLDEES